MKRIEILLVISLVTFLSASFLVGVKPAFAASATENTWTTKTPMPETMWGIRAAVVDGKIYVIGGSINYQYDPATDTWTAKTAMPTPRQWFGMVVCQNKIFTIGGYNFNNGDPLYYSVNEVYDPATDAWQTKQPMPTARENIQANVVNGEIYLIGGRTGGPYHEAVALNEVYNVANDSWITKEPMPYPVASYASAVSGGKIYIMDRQYTQIYAPLDNSWSFGASMPTKVTGAAAGATSGVMALRRIYLFGGSLYGDVSGESQDVVQVYDPESNAWTYGEPMPTARVSLTIAVVNDKLYAIGGSPQAVPGPDDSFKVNEEYTPLGYGMPDPSYVLQTTPPKIMLLSPLNQGYNETDVPLLFNVDKVVSWTGYSLDGQQNVTVTGNSTLTELSSGSHSIIVYANDTFGNMGASEIVTFTMPESFPVATAFAASGVITAVFVGAGIALYWKKRRSQQFS